MTETKRVRINREIRELEEVARFTGLGAVKTWIADREENLIRQLRAAFVEDPVNRDTKVRYVSQEIVTLRDFEDWIDQADIVRKSKEAEREELSDE